MGEKTDLYPQRYRLQLRSHLVKFLDVSPRPHQILGLDFNRSHLSVLRILLDILDQLLLLVLELRAFAVQLPLRLLERALMFPETLRRRHAFAEGPFDDLPFLCQPRQLWRECDNDAYIHGCGMLAAKCEVLWQMVVVAGMRVRALRTSWCLRRSWKAWSSLQSPKRERYRLGRCAINRCSAWTLVGNIPVFGTRLPAELAARLVLLHFLA